MNKPIIVPKGDKTVELNLECCNWPKDFPYKPEVTTTLWHDSQNLYIKYNVVEDYVAAKATADNGEVWKDSCVEFFIAFDNDGYYNIESNCGGKILLSHRKARKENVEYAPKEILDAIKREPSLGDKPFECRKSDGPWSMTLKIPVSTFFKHKIKNFDGLQARCNIYKCGDDLPVAHFISHFPIKTENPDFHCPGYFGPIIFE